MSLPGLAVGLTQKEPRYAAVAAIRPNQVGPPAIRAPERHGRFSQVYVGGKATA